MGLPLLDATGTPVPSVAPAPAKSVKPPDGVDFVVTDRFFDYPVLHPSRVERALHLADQGEPYEYMRLCDEMLKKDPKIQSVVGTRTKAVLGINHEIRPAKLDDAHAGEQPVADEVAAFCDAAFTRAGGRRLIGHLMDSVGRGIAVDWIDWEYIDGKVVPTAFRRIPPTHLRWGTFADTIRVWDPGTASMSGGEIGTPLDPYTTVRALDSERADHPASGGLFQPTSWFYLFKNYTIKDWLALANTYASPQQFLALNPDDFTDPAMFDRAQAALRNLKNFARGVIKDQWKLETIGTNATNGAELLSKLLDMLDKAIGQLWLGHELSSQSSPGSGQLGITAAIQLRQDYLESDCNARSEEIRRDVLVPIVGWNWGWDKLYLTPVSTFDYEPPRDLVAQAQVDANIAGRYPKVERSKAQIREVYGWDAPIDEADSVTASAAAGTGTFGKQPEQANTPAGTPVNSAAPALTLAGKKSTPAKKQARIDKVTSKTASALVDLTDKWKAQLRTMLREATSQGLSLPEIGSRIAAAYPDLDANQVQRVLQEQMLLVRLFGRNVENA